MTTTCRVAVIGAGNMALQHVRAFRDVPGARVAGVYSRTSGRAEELARAHGIETVASSIDDLYQRTQADLVVIGVSELSCEDVVGQASRHPWTALIEKPVGHDVPSAERIAARARERGLRAFVALNRRHYSSTRNVVEALSKSTAPRLIQVFDQEDIVAARNAGVPDLVVQNWMYANSLHVIDYFRVLARGSVVAVEPVVRWNPNEPRFVAAKVSFSSGDVGLYQGIWNGPGPWAVTVSTQDARYEMRPLEQASVTPYGSRKAEVMPVHAWDTAFKPGLRFQAEEAVKATMGHQHTLPTLEDGLESMRLVRSIYASD